jgi:hypothetical protein
MGLWCEVWPDMTRSLAACAKTGWCEHHEARCTALTCCLPYPHPHPHLFGQVHAYPKPGSKNTKLRLDFVWPRPHIPIELLQRGLSDSSLPCPPGRARWSLSCWILSGRPEWAWPGWGPPEAPATSNTGTTELTQALGTLSAITRAHHWPGILQYSLNPPPPV